MRTSKWVIALLMLFGLCAACRAQGDESDCRGEYRKQSITFRDYRINVYRGSGGCLRIYKAQKLVFQETEALKYVLGGNVNAKERAAVKPTIGSDITGLGEPNLVVSSWTGGAHCCFDFQVFELGDKFRAFQKIYGADGDGSYFKDVNHDGKMEFIGADWTFDYWHASFMDSPAPEVILRFKDSRYVLATELMRKAAPNKTEIATTAAKLRADETWNQHFEDWEDRLSIPPELWRRMLEWIYQGQAESAWKLLDLAWPEKRGGKEKFLSEFCSRLKSSDYWEDLAPTVGPLPHVCQLAPPERGRERR